MHPTLLDAAGHRRAAVTLPGYHSGRPPRNKGRRYPADPPTVVGSAGYCSPLLRGGRPRW
jgi:hypothetical protein